MKILFEIDQNVEELKVLIQAKEYSEDIGSLMMYLEEYGKLKEVIAIKEEDYIHVIMQKDIEILEVMGNVITITTPNKQYKTKNRLYKILDRLSAVDFVKVSKSSVINIKALLKLETSFSGNMLAIMKSGEKVNVTRSYLGELKSKLNI